jgi:hypothetical protein
MFLAEEKAMKRKKHYADRNERLSYVNPDDDKKEKP